MQPQPPPGPSNNPSGQSGNPQDGNPQPQSGYPPGQYGYPQQGQPAPGQAGYPQQGQPAGYPQAGQPIPGQTGYPQAADPTTQMPQGQQPDYPHPWQTAGQAGYPQPGQSGADPTTHLQQTPGQANYPQPGQDSSQQGFAQPGQPAASGQTSYPQGQFAPGQQGYDPNAYPQGPTIATGGQPQSWGNGATAAGAGRRRKSGLGSLAGLAVVIGLIYLASWGCHQITKPDAEKVQVGQCVKVAGTTNHPKVDITDCSSMDANYKVAERQDKSTSTCPDRNYASVWQTGSGGYNLCLQLNVKDGDCLDKQSDNTVKVACDSPEANYKVTNVLNNTTSDSGCSNSATKFLTYSKPEEMVVCLSTVH